MFYAVKSDTRFSVNRVVLYTRNSTVLHETKVVLHGAKSVFTYAVNRVILYGVEAFYFMY
jgi:hypothetical protein